MTYFFDVILIGFAAYYLTELLTFFWGAPRLAKILFDAALSLAAAFLLYPIALTSLIPYLAANCVASVLRIAVDAVVSKPAVVRRR